VDGTWDANPADNDCNSSANDIYNIYHTVSSNCAILSFSGSPFIRVFSGGVFYLNGSGGVTGSVDIQVDAGGTIIILGDLNITGSSDIVNNGTIQVHGDVIRTGGGSSFDCNGTSGAGVVQIGGTGCTACTGGSASGCNQNLPLPVNLASFTSEVVSSGIMIYWTTMYEKDNAWFELERSTDAIHYTVIYRRPGQSYFETKTDYSFFDSDVQEGETYYYRLVQIDSDDSRTRTEAISETFGFALASISILPNPSAASDLKIAMHQMAHEDVLLVLYDVNGNIVYSKMEHLNSDEEVFSANDLHVDLAPGIYMVAASNKNQLVKKKLIIY
jgi:hypothetical protein